MWPSQVGRAYRLLEMVGEGCPGHGPIHLLVASAAEIGFRWDPLILAWSRPGLPLLRNLASPIQHFRAAILDAWRNKAAADLCGREGFRGGPLLDVHGSLQLLNSSHVRDRDKGLLRSILFGGVWNGFLLSKVRSSLFNVGFVLLLMGMVICFWECTFPPLEIRENPEFHDLMREDKAHWPRCLLWHGWLPMLSGVNGASLWATDASESAFYFVETALGRYSSGLVSEWSHPFDFDADEVSSRMPDAPEVWSGGSMILDSVIGVSAAGAGIFAHQSELCWGDRRWGHVDRVQCGNVAHSCRVLCLSLVLCRLFRGLSCGESLLLFSLLIPVHIGVDNLGVVRHVGRLLDGCSFSAPLELVTDGDLLLLLRRMIDRRGRDTVRFTKFKGHADESMVSDGRVRELDRLGNNAADEAADFGRRRVGPAVIDARRNLSGVCGRWYPVLLDLHRFFIAISRAVVNHDGFGGTALDRMVWSAGSLPKRRRIVHAVRDLAMLPGPLWLGGWFAGPSAALDADDVAQWPYTPGLLVKWVSFLGSC